MFDLNKILNEKVVEPRQRVKGNISPEWIVHRFPIKGGISRRDMWIRNMAQSNKLLLRLKEMAKNGK